MTCQTTLLERICRRREINQLFAALLTYRTTSCVVSNLDKGQQCRKYNRKWPKTCSRGNKPGRCFVDPPALVEPAPLGRKFSISVLTGVHCVRSSSFISDRFFGQYSLHVTMGQSSYQLMEHLCTYRKQMPLARPTLIRYETKERSTALRN
jgi:hypothetical protein